MRNEHNLVGRTVAITWGALAKETGERLAALLAVREGPETAVAIIHISDANADDFAAHLSDALIHISPPNLAGLLAQAGWQLRLEREIQVVLVVDAVDGAAETAVWMGETAIETAYRQLGVESQIALLWLAPELDETAETCVQAAASFSFTPHVMALNPANEAGLRLPTPDLLSAVGAELLWALSATPFHDFLRGIFTDVDQIYTGAPAFVSLGVSVWEWSPTAVYDSFVRRWQYEALNAWLDNTETEPASEAIAAWQQRQGLDKESLLARFMAERDMPLPAYGRIVRHFPWPWETPDQINRLKISFQEDVDDVAAFRRQAAQEVAEKQAQAAAQITLYLTSVLDEQPIGGIDNAARWAWSLAAAFDADYEKMLDEAAVYDEIDSDLAVERGQIETRIRDLVTDWPGVRWHRWLRIIWRVWQWPQLVWQYWQLRQLGLRLAGLLAQQSARQREQASRAVVARLMAELARLARQEHSRAAEVGEMLACWREEIREKGEIKDEKEENGVAAAALPIPDELYGRLITDPEREAVLATEAIGGLGRQLERLDDAIMIPLAKLAGERMAKVWTVTAVDILDALLPAANEWQTWQQTAWQAATPLWRYDEGQLSETARRGNWAGAYLIGAGADRLPAIWADLDGEVFTELDQPCHWLPSADHSRLIIIRLRKNAQETEVFYER
ncbi:MAG: hypothetical protein GY803_12635 [Chloroflexi bacterium]|nr:hypothetical protein [Chloroflexota bacterium]